jgi:hypothetical protein
MQKNKTTSNVFNSAILQYKWSLFCQINSIVVGRLSWVDCRLSWVDCRDLIVEIRLSRFVGRDSWVEIRDSWVSVGASFF